MVEFRYGLVYLRKISINVESLRVLKNMLKLLYITIHVLMVLMFLIFVLSILGMIHGSLEMYPTGEQQEKARLAYGVIAFITIFLEFIFIKAKNKLKKKAKSVNR